MARKVASWEALLDTDGPAGPEPGGVDVVFDFGEAATRWDIWWVWEGNVDGDGFEDIMDLKVIGASSFQQGWQEMNVGMDWATFSSSYPAGD